MVSPGYRHCANCIGALSFPCSCCGCVKSTGGRNKNGTLRGCKANKAQRTTTKLITSHDSGLPNLAVLLEHCGQLIFRKISKFDAIRCQILKQKYIKFDFRWGSASDPTGGAYIAPPDPLAVFKGPT